VIETDVATIDASRPQSGDRHKKTATPKRPKPKRAAKPSGTYAAKRFLVRKSKVVAVFARNVKHHREKLGMNQAAFGALVGLD
jgi:ribosome-binding protein aMBF1 (putative translation factor)